MKMITAQEKLERLSASCDLLSRCVKALEQSDHLGAIVQIEHSDREEDIDIAITALHLGGWHAETVAEYPPGKFTKSESGDKLRIYQGLTGQRKADAPSGGGH
jgi:hypothetical protein